MLAVIKVTPGQHNAWRQMTSVVREEYFMVYNYGQCQLPRCSHARHFSAWACAPARWPHLLYRHVLQLALVELLAPDSLGKNLGVRRHNGLCARGV